MTILPWEMLSQYIFQTRMSTQFCRCITLHERRRCTDGSSKQLWSGFFLKSKWERISVARPRMKKIVTRSCPRTSLCRRGNVVEQRRQHQIRIRIHKYWNTYSFPFFAFLASWWLFVSLQIFLLLIFHNLYLSQIIATTRYYFALLDIYWT